MALFGFNKQKVLAAAEKYVQQGKLQNAISEYEKILKNDPKDLTVTNTVGDLYSRIGESDKATECFKNVGDAYAAQGFTVKAIAMYKKIGKLKPSLESLLKLAELYTQQGLYNDARAQYLQVAEEFLKAGELENAVRIFQKILEMDPENSVMRVRLAEVYVRLGKKNEAWEIFTAAAESMRSKGALSGAEEVLQRMLALDPGNNYALVLQGKNLLESGDAAGALAVLQKVADIDSNPDALRDLLRAYLQSGQLSEAGAVANKLLTVHNDLGAISSLADALMQAGQFENALQVYDQHAERLLAENSEKVLDHLHAIIGHVRDNPDSLQKLLDLFNKAGETTHVGEVLELLAHASVQAGDLTRARDLYQRLAQLEPQNPLHMQNYQQVVSQMGGSTGSKLITPEEAVVLIDDLEATAPSIHQHYSDEVALAVRSALTDAELFISYNMPQKALGPLMAALPMAPNDLRINQRLAALHTRASRFAEAGQCCRTLQTLYSDAEYPEEATRYGELADRYEERSSAPEPAASDDEAPIFLDAPPATHRQAHHQAAVGGDVSVDEVSESGVAEEEEIPVAEEEPAAEAGPAASPWPTASDEPQEITVSVDPELPVVGHAPVHAPEHAAEIDLSSEWDDAITVDADELTAPVEESELPVTAEAGSGAEHQADDAEISVDEDPVKVDETAEEIRFYVANGMPEQALAALAKLQTLTSDEAKIEELRSEVEAAALHSSEDETSIAIEPVEDLTGEDIPEITLEDDAPAALEEAVPEEVSAPHESPVAAEEPVEEDPAAIEAEASELEVHPIMAEAEGEPEAAFAEPVPPEFEISEPELVVPAPVAAKTSRAPISGPAPVAVVPVTPAPVAPVPVAPAPPKPTPAAAETKPAVLKELVSDLESSVGDHFLPTTVARPVEPPSAPAAHQSASAHSQPGTSTGRPPVLEDFVAEIEASLGDDFLKAAPVARSVATSVPDPIAPPTPSSAPAQSSRVSAPLAASAAAAASSVSPVVTAGPARAALSHADPPRTTPPHAPAASPSLSPVAAQAGIDLAEMFGELRHDLEAESAGSDEDPETHYSLGIAFREMGLLDEAIGELQKACQAFDRGHPFAQIMQTYTWLAQCFLEMGVPEAAVRWYGKALQVPGIDSETRVALDYELASAYEAAGEKESALRYFLEVYGSNIDYRDVAERIKALKS